jgi:DNA repair protein RadC
MTYQIVSERKIRTPHPLKNPAEIYALVKRYARKEQEHFIVITLDGAHKPISVVIASIGLVNKTLIHPREVFVRAIRDMAAAIIICHNHPSGALSPSAEDIEITERLTQAGEVLGIPVIDHLIITKAGWFGFAQEGRLPKKEQ